MNNNLIENRLIRVFISSTFQDMQDERDELMKKTFPVLKQKAAERDVTLTELDLRWGITPEESTSGKVVEICLQEIENSVPFFVGIIGNRYGWIPSSDDLGEGLTERFSQVKGYVDRHLSVTEMEMQFGVLERKEKMHAFFYIKEQEDVAVDEPEKLAELKAQIRRNGRYPVLTYSSTENLAMQVEKAFSKLLDELYPEGVLSELEKERIGQRAYLNSLCQNYIRTESNFAAIEEWVSDWEKHQLVITGASGLGKSALVANWVKKKLATGDELPYRIIYHFVGNGGSLGSHGHVIKALCDEIRDRYGFDLEHKDTKTDEKALEGLFNRVAAEGDKPLVIVLDAVNQIIDTEHSKRLNWLPIPPKKVKILFTTLENDETMEVFRDRHYPVFILRPLIKRQRRGMVRHYLSLFSKKLQPCQVDRIVDDKQCKNTLVLKTLLDELINFGIYEKLDEKIGTHLGTSSVEEFYGILLNGYEDDFGKRFVKHILSLIAVSRNGLSEEEILAITQEPTLHWSQFFCAIRQHLVVKNGLISFAHSFIRFAVESRYLKAKDDWGEKCRMEIVSFFNGSKTFRAIHEVPFQYDKLNCFENLHDYLLDLEVFSHLYDEEQYTLGKYWQRLRDERGYSLETYLALIDEYPESDRPVLMLKLSQFCESTIICPDLSLQFILGSLPFIKDEKLRAPIVNQIGSSYSLLGNNEEALKYQLEGLDSNIAFFGENHPNTAASYGSIGNTYRELGDYQKALDYGLRALKIERSVFDENHLSISTSYNNIGITYGCLGDLQKELDYEQKALDICIRNLGESHPETATTYNNLGITYAELGDYPKALEYNQKALKSRLTIFGERHAQTALSYDSIGWIHGILGDYQKEIEFEQMALMIRSFVFGEKHPDTVESYVHLGLAYEKIGEYQKALEHEIKALKIGSVLFGKRHPHMVALYHNVGNAYGSLGNHREAFKYHQQSLNLGLQLFNENHPNMAFLYECVGINYEDLGDFDKGLEYELKALRIRRSVLGENHPDTARVYYNVGGAYGALGDFQKAIEYQQKALEIQQSVFEEEHPEIATSYNSIGTFYFCLGEYEKGLDFCQKALNIRLVVLGELHPDTAQSFERVAQVHNALKEHKKEITCLQKAMDIRLRLFGEDNADIAKLFNNIGAAEGKLGHVEKEIKLRKKGLEIAIRIGDDDLIAILYNRVGYAFKAAGKQIIANDYFRLAADKYREIGDEDQARENMALIEE